MSEFDTFEINPKLKNAIKKMGYTIPTAVQTQSIPLMINGNNVLSRSFTGSGKTLVFGVSLAERILAGKSNNALILCPTRELAIQIKEELIRLNIFTGLKVNAVYGGHGINSEINSLRKGVNILCATPGRLLDHLERKTVDPTIFDTVVLDEADRMLDMGFIDDLKKILKRVSPKNTHLFSATVDGRVTKLIKEYMPTYKEVIIKDELVGTNIIEQTIKVDRNNKFDILLDLVKSSDGRFLIFVSTKRYVDLLGKKLRESGLKNTVIHGDKSQKSREFALEEFKSGKKRILIATDVAARGIHVENIEYVINYDVANDADTHKHRIGRTGRMKQGHAITFLSDDGQRTGGRFQRRGSGSRGRGSDFRRRSSNPREGGFYTKRKRSESHGKGFYTPRKDFNSRGNDSGSQGNRSDSRGKSFYSHKKSSGPYGKSSDSYKRNDQNEGSSSDKKPFFKKKKTFSKGLPFKPGKRNFSKGKTGRNSVRY